MGERCAGREVLDSRDDQFLSCDVHMYNTFCRRELCVCILGRWVMTLADIRSRVSHFFVCSWERGGSGIGNVHVIPRMLGWHRWVSNAVLIPCCTGFWGIARLVAEEVETFCWRVDADTVRWYRTLLSLIFCCFAFASQVGSHAGHKPCTLEYLFCDAAVSTTDAQLADCRMSHGWYVWER